MYRPSVDQCVADIGEADRNRICSPPAPLDSFSQRLYALPRSEAKTNRAPSGDQMALDWLDGPNVSRETVERALSTSHRSRESSRRSRRSTTICCPFGESPGRT